jgi:hypothetical protein
MYKKNVKRNKVGINQTGETQANAGASASAGKSEDS